ncbi:MAG TPA: DUF58 domain-containing protein [Polyangiaceae bacterium]|nr:DUF58 domain-containing protein [Polyangiaceae bacterium]
MTARVTARIAKNPIRTAIDWGELAPLRLRARQIAEGVYAGVHRSALRGSGVEFGGYREYVPGDDLRWLDRRSLLRHDRLVVRQFETETDRTLSLLIDASASMGYRGSGAPASKIAFASLLAAALGRIALAGGEPVGVSFVGGGPEVAPVARAGGRDQFERIVVALEQAETGGDARADGSMVEKAVHSLVRSTRRGGIVVVLSDLLDLPDDAADRISGIAPSGRVLVVVQTLDPSEVDFPFTGTVRLRALEGGAVVETDASTARDRYLEALDSLTRRWREAVVGRGGRFLRAVTADPPVQVVRDIVRAVR